MKYLLKFNENVTNLDYNFFVLKKGCVKMDIVYNHWESNFRYYFSDNIFIDLIKFKDEGNIHTIPTKVYVGYDYKYYLCSYDDDGIINRFFIGYYNGNYLNIYKINNFTESDPELNYLRMMNICNYLLPFFEKKPSRDVISEIEEHFVLLTDILDDPDIKWGYNNQREFGFFPANEYSNKLGLSLSYINKNNINYDIIKNEYEKIKRTFVLLKIEYKSINIYSLYDNYDIIIVIGI